MVGWGSSASLLVKIKGAQRPANAIGSRITPSNRMAGYVSGPRTGSWESDDFTSAISCIPVGSLVVTSRRGRDPLFVPVFPREQDAVPGMGHQCWVSGTGPPSTSGCASCRAGHYACGRRWCATQETTMLDEQAAQEASHDDRCATATQHRASRRPELHPKYIFSTDHRSSGSTSCSSACSSCWWRLLRCDRLAARLSGSRCRRRILPEAWAGGSFCRSTTSLVHDARTFMVFLHHAVLGVCTRTS